MVKTLTPHGYLKKLLGWLGLSTRDSGEGPRSRSEVDRRQEETIRMAPSAAPAKELPRI